MKSLSRQMLAYGIGLSVSKLQVFALLLIVPQFLSPEEYGVFDAIASLTFLISILATLNLDTAVGNLYHDRQDAQGRRQVVGTGLWLNFLAAIVSVSVFSMMAPYVSRLLFKTEAFSDLIALAGVSAVLSGVLATQLGYLRYRFMLKEHNLLQIGGSVLVFVLTMMLVARVHLGVYGLIYGNIGGTLVALLASCYISRAEIRTRPQWSTAQTLLKTGLALLPFTIASWALAFVDRSILLMYRPVEEVGLYGVAVRFAQAILLLLAPFQNAWLPYALATWQRSDAPAMFSRVMRMFLAVAGVSVVVCSAIFQLLILLALPAAYHESARYVPILTLSYLFATLYYFPFVSLMARKKSWLASIVFGLGALFNIGLNLLFAPTYGIAAATWATLAGYVLVLIVVFVLAERYLPWPYPYLQIVALVLLAIALCATGFILPVTSLQQVLAIGAVATLVYTLVAWRLGFVEWVDAKALIRTRLKIRLDED